MRMLGSIAHSRQGRARDLTFARARRTIAVGRRMVSIALRGFVQIALHFFLQQAQVQVFQGIGIQAGRVVGLVLGHQRDSLQVARYFLEAQRVEAIRTQSLEEQQRLERRVGSGKCWAHMYVGGWRGRIWPALAFGRKTTAAATARGRRGRGG
jgi:hypothetical protein